MSQFDQKKIFEALKYLRNNNPLYSDIEIDKNSLLRLLSTDFTDDIPITLEERTRHENHNSRNENILEDKEEIENTLQKYQHLASESLVVNNDIYELHLEKVSQPKEFYMMKTTNNWHSHNVLEKVDLDIQYVIIWK